MNKSIPALRKKRGRPATGVDPMLNFRSPPALTAALDAWIAAQPEPRPSRSEAIRSLLAVALDKPAALTSASTEKEIAAERALLAIRRNSRRMSATELLRALIAICDAI
jgi:hypothetical protein